MREPLSSKLIPRARPGRATSNGAELAGGILVFFLFGFLLDIWLGTQPLFMIVLSVFAMVGTGVRAYYSYDEQMKKHEEDRRNGAVEERQ